MAKAPSKPSAKAKAKAKAKQAPLSVSAQVALPWDRIGLIAGVDEAGRGPLAGPVVAAAVILDDDKPIIGLNDSKKLSAAKRDKLYDEIMAKALCCSVAQASIAEIESLNILHATMLAMRRAIEGLRLLPVKVLIDGNRIPTGLNVLAEAIVGGDASEQSISAASIIAKVTRDRWCDELHARYPQYGFAQHKGYGTAQHLAAIAEHGPCPEHRMGFAPLCNMQIATQTAKQLPTQTTTT